LADPLRVLHLIDTGGPGGAETILLEVVTRLDARRWRSVAVVPEVDWLHGALRERGVEPLVLPSRGTGNALYLARLHRLVRRTGAHLVHTHLLGSAVYASLAVAPLRVPVVATFHGLPDFPETGRLLGLKLRLIWRDPNRVVFVSESLKAAVFGRYRLPEQRVRVVPNGVAWEPPAALGTEREELGARPGDLVIGAVGNVRPTKDYPTLLRAVARLRADGLPVRLAILGQGTSPLLDELVALRRNLGLEDAVGLLGFRDDARRLLTAFDVFVSSSTTEGFSLSTVEAMLAGRAVVATRSGGPEEILRDGETGILVPTGDPEALAVGMARVLRDERLGARLGMCGAEDAAERFGVEAMIRGYEDVYEEVLQGAS
jgi:glycosyltransferase involved in cell wall biosynthesis